MFSRAGQEQKWPDVRIKGLLARGVSPEVKCHVRHLSPVEVTFAPQIPQVPVQTLARRLERLLGWGTIATKTFPCF